VNDIRAASVLGLSDILVVTYLVNVCSATATVTFLCTCDVCVISVSDQSRFSFSCSNLDAASFTASTPIKKSFVVSTDSLVRHLLYFTFARLQYITLQQTLYVIPNPNKRGGLVS